MRIDERAWVFDTGPLRHFAAQQWLGVIKFLAGDRPVVIPESVERELMVASSEHLVAARQILDADWIDVYRTEELQYLVEFARYEDHLVADGKNFGECGVLAMGKLFGCEMVIDDSVPRKLALDEGLPVTATVNVLCDAIREKQLTTPMVENLADSLLSGNYWLPFGPGGFRAHVLQEGLLDYEDFM